MDTQYVKGLTFKLRSILVSARWIDSEVMAVSPAGLEVTTAFVANGTPIEINIKDAEGRPCGQIAGEILHQRFHTTILTSEKTKGHLVFNAELPGLNLEERSKPLRILQWI